MRSARFALIAFLGLAPLAVAIRRAVTASPGATTRAVPGEQRPADWRGLSAAGFTDYAAQFPAETLPAEDLEALLVLAASGEGEVPTRATVLIGLVAARGSAALGARAREGLLIVLTERTAPEGRERIGRTIVAARALRSAAAESAEVRKDLVFLATGPGPHPDLPTRVECAYTLCEAGAVQDVLPFLLSVLRAETPDQAKSPRTWERMTTLAWVKTRAAEALTRAARTDLRFHPDASWAAQMNEADRLEALLRPR